MSKAFFDFDGCYSQCQGKVSYQATANLSPTFDHLNSCSYCSDQQVMDSIDQFVKRGLYSPQAVAKADVDQILLCITGGLPSIKARHILACANRLVTDYGGLVPYSYSKLMATQQVSVKTEVTIKVDDPQAMKEATKRTNKHKSPRKSPTNRKVLPTKRKRAEVEVADTAVEVAEAAEAEAAVAAAQGRKRSKQFVKVFPGVGDKGARIILDEGFNIVHGFPVDVHLKGFLWC